MFKDDYEANKDYFQGLEKEAEPFLEFSPTIGSFDASITMSDGSTFIFMILSLEIVLPVEALHR